MEYFFEKYEKVFRVNFLTYIILIIRLKKINKEIKEKEDILARYGMAIEKIKNPENVVTMLI